MTRPPLTAAPFTLERGTTEAVLLVHGLGGGPYEVQRVAEALSLTASCVVLPGHEVRSGAMPHSTWRAWFEHVSASYDGLARAHRVVHLVGFSTGAVLALRLVQERSLTSRVVLLAPFLRVFRPRLSPVPTEALLRAASFVHALPRLPPPLRDSVMRAEVDALIGFNAFSLDAARSALELIALVESSLHAVRAPTLLIQGRRDTVVDPRGAEILHRGIQHSALHVVDSNHLVALDSAGSEVVRRAVAFLENPEPPHVTSHSS